MSLAIDPTQRFLAVTSVATQPGGRVKSKLYVFKMRILKNLLNLVLLDSKEELVDEMDSINSIQFIQHKNELHLIALTTGCSKLAVFKISNEKLVLEGQERMSHKAPSDSNSDLVVKGRTVFVFNGNGFMRKINL